MFAVQVFKALIGNGFCNDETNNAENEYDGGDCCGYNANKEYCSHCECYHNEMCTARITHPTVGDGYCNDETNIVACNYDGGDCCGVCLIGKYCSACKCLSDIVVGNPVVANGVCDDHTNNAKCNYDGGDCCLSNVNTEHCSSCACFANGVITSPGFPRNYHNNIDLTWLIQVPIGHLVEMEFVDFDVEYDSICQ